MSSNKFSWYDSFMQDRYGADELGLALSSFGLVLIVINLFVNSWVITLIITALVLIQFPRILSKNKHARQRENDAFLKLVKSPAQTLSRLFERARTATAERQQYKHLTCPTCKQKVRVPRGKGKLRVTCPSCKTKFEARS